MQQGIRVMNTCKTRTQRGGFTLIELMVVIAVIALLVGLLLPAMGMVRTKARYAQGNSQFGALELGVESFRGESMAGGRLPPSASDWAADHLLIADPRATTDPQRPDMQIAGAHLLLQAMLGADLLSTPGFVDTDGDGFWSDDTHAGTDGAYELDASTSDTLRARYGGGGYVDDKMKAHAKSLRELRDRGTILQMLQISDETAEQLLFVDPWDHPILYYRANRAARLMMGDGNDIPGIYRQEDNGIITGSRPDGALGIDFGSGYNSNHHYHGISVVEHPPPTPSFTGPINDILLDNEYEDTLARFVFDSSVRARNTPVRKDSFLLISAGPDGRYGTNDDITNWDRERD